MVLGEQIAHWWLSNQTGFAPIFCSNDDFYKISQCHNVRQDLMRKEMGDMWYHVLSRYTHFPVLRFNHDTYISYEDK